MEHRAAEPGQFFNRNAIATSALELLPIEPVTIQPFSENAFLLETVQSSLALWVYRGLESVLAFQEQMQKKLWQWGFSGFLTPRELRDGRTYAEWDDDSWFYITNWPDCGKVSFSDPKHIEAMLDLIIEFRKVMAASGTLFTQPEPIEGGLNLFDQIVLKKELLTSLEMLAKHRLKPSKFDQLFLANFRRFSLQAEEGLEILQSVAYRDLIQRLNNTDVILYRIDRRNIRVTANGKAICLRPGNFQVEYPVLDLAILLNKTGRSNRWDYDWWQGIVKSYERHFKLSAIEVNIILAYLRFPWEFYQLAENYYLNQTDSSLWLLVDKFERLLRAEIRRENLFQELNKSFK